jgi:CRISPR system Cascade subunit CasE
VYLARLTLNPGSQLVRQDLLNGQSLHRRLLGVFGGDDAGGLRARVGLLHRLEQHRETIQILAQTVIPAPWELLPRGYLLEPPERRDLGPLLDSLRPHQVWRFRLVARPVTCTNTPPGQWPVTLRRSPGGRYLLYHATAPEQIAWLRRRVEAHGFSLRLGDDPVPDPRIQHAPPVPIVRKGSGRAVLTGVRFDGLLAIADPEAARSTVLAGIGRGKSYGFGLLSLAPL